MITPDRDRASNDYTITRIPRIKDEMHPGEVSFGQVILNTYKAGDYELSFGYGMSMISNEVNWKFNVSEAK